MSMINRSHTVKTYEGDLENIKNTLILMFDKVNELIHFADSHLGGANDGDYKLAMEQDIYINKLESSVEEMAVSVLALRQPMAIDLRFIVSAMKVSSVLESIGDLAKNTVKRIAGMENSIPENTLFSLRKIADLAFTILSHSFNTFVSGNIQDLDSVLDEDNAIDHLYKELFLASQQEMLSRPETSLMFRDVVFIAKNFERIGDYSGKIALATRYIVTGSRFKGA